VTSDVLYDVRGRVASVAWGSCRVTCGSVITADYSRSQNIIAGNIASDVGGRVADVGDVGQITLGSALVAGVSASLVSQVAPPPPLPRFRGACLLCCVSCAVWVLLRQRDLCGMGDGCCCSMGDGCCRGVWCGRRDGWIKRVCLWIK
jgi:hypothetical protein